MINDVVDVDAERHSVLVVRALADPSSASATAAATTTTAPEPAAAEAATATACSSATTASIAPHSASPRALWVLLLVTSLGSVILATAPGLTVQASRRRRTKADGFGEVHAYADRARPVAKIARNDLIAWPGVRIENAERRNDRPWIAGICNSGTVAKNAVPVVVKSGCDVERAARRYVD